MKSDDGRLQVGPYDEPKSPGHAQERSPKSPGHAQEPMSPSHAELYPVMRDPQGPPKILDMSAGEGSELEAAHRTYVRPFRLSYHEKAI